MDKRFPDDFKNHMTRYYLIPKNPDKFNSRCYWIIGCRLWRWSASLGRLFGGNWKVESYTWTIYLGCNLHSNLQTKTAIRIFILS